MEARDERRLLKLQAQLAAVKLLIVDELGYVPLSQTGAELLFEIFSQRHEHGSTIVTSNLPFEEWTSVFGNQRLTGALLDRLTHHVHILELNGESYRLKQSKARRRRDPRPPDEVAAAADPETGEIIRASLKATSARPFPELRASFRSGLVLRDAPSVLARLGSQLGGFPTSTGIPDMSWTLAEKNWSLSLSD